MSIQNLAIEKLLLGLKNLGCDYLVIDKDQNKYENGNVFRKNGVKKRQFSHPYGTLKKYYLPFIENLQPGDSASVPISGFTFEEIQHGLTSTGSAIWGNGTYMTSRNVEAKTVEIIRIS
jgi:hypothetical protein